MKKFSKALLLIPALMLAGCNLNKEDLISSYIDGGGNGGSQGGGSGFNLSMAEGGHSAVKELSEREGGVSITFKYASYVDSEEMNGATVKLSRVNNLEWATVDAFYMDGADRVEASIGGAIEISANDETAIDAYYLNPEDQKYHFYGTSYNPEVRLLAETFTFELLEQYLTLDNAYLAAAIYMGIDGTIGDIIAGQQCMTFTLNAANCPDIFTGRDTLTFSFSLSTRLLMRAHLSTWGTDTDGSPVLYQANVDVSGFSAAGTLPTLVRD